MPLHPVPFIMPDIVFQILCFMALHHVLRQVYCAAVDVVLNITHLLSVALEPGQYGHLVESMNLHRYRLRAW